MRKDFPFTSNIAVGLNMVATLIIMSVSILKGVTL